MVCGAHAVPHARAKAPTELAPLSGLKIWVINYIFPLGSHHASSLSLSPSLSGIAKWNCCAAGARVASRRSAPRIGAFKCVILGRQRRAAYNNQYAVCECVWHNTRKEQALFLASICFDVLTRCCRLRCVRSPPSTLRQSISRAWRIYNSRFANKQFATHIHTPFAVRTNNVLDLRRLLLLMICTGFSAHFTAQKVLSWLTNCHDFRARANTRGLQFTASFSTLL